MRILIRYFFRTLRVILTPFLLLGDKLTTPKSMERDPSDQARIDAETRELALYQFPACPFCVKVRRAIQRLGLNIELRDAQSDRENRNALIEGGGKPQVPCLRIPHPDGSVEWMYESADIIRYLEKRFGDNPSRSAD
jgi:glutaredoxin